MAPDEMPSLAEVGARLFQALREAGFDSIEIDPQGYRGPSL